MSRLLPADGHVAVAVATTGADAEACLAQTRAAAAAGADVVELRADLLAGPGPRISSASRSEGSGRPSRGLRAGRGNSRLDEPLPLSNALTADSSSFWIMS